MEADIKWLWKKTQTEEFYEPYTTSYEVVLGTRQPLLEDHFTCALRHLFRKVPVLRTCYGERNGEMWLREMSQEKIDFQVIENVTREDVHKELHRYSFDMNGPLWCVKLLRGSVGGDSVQEYPHVYTVFIGIHHVITDGTTNMMICGFLVQVLDDVIAGRPISDEQLAVFVSPEKTDAIINKKVETLRANSELLFRQIKEFQAWQQKSLFKSTYKKNEDTTLTTGFETIDFDYDTTASFLQRCRAEGVTVNSAYTAIANLAMMDLLIDGGLGKDTYNIRSDHVFNARRYWGEDSGGEYLGCHVMPLVPVTVETPRNARENIWNYVRLTNCELRKKITTDAALQEEAIKKCIPEYSGVFEFDYTVSNMGDVTRLVMKGSQNVQPIYIFRSAAIHTVPATFCHFVHTFRSRLAVNILYSTERIKPETAKQCGQLIFKYLHASLRESE
ncbi:uncharacterized protein LOC134781503 [Penaeus indicus]|uniref:uncharacterized protein LOC134781503 n=1 Tax=Penaeus indicus TaxID=29960 RepID=UPI00300CB367